MAAAVSPRVAEIATGRALVGPRLEASLMPIGVGFTGLPASAVLALGVAGVGALVALHLARRRPRRIIVAALRLWAPGADARPAHRLAGTLRDLALLLLHLVIFAAVLVAAAAPRLSAPGTGVDASGRTMVMLIDRSASMQATDEPGSRLARAQALARAFIDALGPADRVLVATFAAVVWPLTALETDHDRLQAAVNSIDASDQTGDPDGALAYAAASLRGRPRPMIVLITDGGNRSPTTDQGAPTLSSQGIALHVLTVGRRRDNVAVVAFSGRRLPADPTRADLVVVTQSFRAAPTTLTLAITSGPRSVPVGERRLRVEADARVVTTFPAVALADPRLQATLQHGGDDLALDDRAFAVVPPAPPVQVRVEGGRDLYLDAALLAMSGNVTVHHGTGAPSSADASPTAPNPGQGEDVVIFDGVTPPHPSRQGAFLYLDPHGAGSPWPAPGTAPVRDPIVSDVSRDHPLMRHVGLSDLNVAAARTLVPGVGDVVVAAAGETPLIIARDRPASGRQIAVAFDPRRSDWPLRGAFPLFLANAIGWLVQRPEPRASCFSTGGTASLSLNAAAGGQLPARVNVVTPDGHRMTTPVIGSSVTVPLDRVGVGTIQDPTGGDVAHFAVNLASPAESDLGPSALADARPPASTAASDPPPTRSHREREPWRVAALAALFLATLEWIAWHLRTTG